MNGYVQSVPGSDTDVFRNQVAYLHVLKRSLKVVPQALILNTSVSVEFAFKTVITASYCFPTYRTRLLEHINYFIPYNFHLDPSLVDVIEFKPNPNSVCRKYEELMPTLDDTELSCLPGSVSPSIVGGSAWNADKMSKFIKSKRSTDY